MATSIYTGFKIYGPQFQAGLWEVLERNLVAFNESSAGALRFQTEEMAGIYEKTAIWTQISDLVARRDITSVSTVSGVAPAQGEIVGVKVDRRIGPIEMTLDALRKAGASQAESSLIIGQMVAEHKTRDLLDTALISAAAAIEGLGATATLDVTSASTTTLTTDALAQALALFGDAAPNVKCWVMHSKPFYNLVREQISAALVNVADKVVYGAMPASLGRPIVVTDAGALHTAVSGGTDYYEVLGLTDAAIITKETETVTPITEVVTGLENLVLRIQGEYSFNLQCRGMGWDTSNGGATPTDATLGTITNWDLVADGIKGGPGIRIKCY